MPAMVRGANLRHEEGPRDPSDLAFETDKVAGVECDSHASRLGLARNEGDQAKRCQTDNSGEHETPFKPFFTAGEASERD